MCGRKEKSTEMWLRPTKTLVSCVFVDVCRVLWVVSLAESRIHVSASGCRRSNQDAPVVLGRRS